MAERVFHKRIKIQMVEKTGAPHYIAFAGKMARGSKKAYGKVRFCAAAEAANVYNYKHKTHVAG